MVGSVDFLVCGEIIPFKMFVVKDVIDAERGHFPGITLPESFTTFDEAIGELFREGVIGKRSRRVVKIAA